MRTFQKLSGVALAAGLSAMAFGNLPSAKADSVVSSTSMAGIAQSNVDEVGMSGLTILKTEKLFRFQARPWARIPQGVAVTVRAPRGTTMADLHNLAVDCTRGNVDERWPLCVEGAAVKVERNGGVYVIQLTSADRSTAVEIQKRADQLR